MDTKSSQFYPGKISLVMSSHIEPILLWHLAIEIEACLRRGPTRLMASAKKLIGFLCATGLGLWSPEATAGTWSDVDALRFRLEQNGVRVTQGNCKRGLQGAYDSRRNYLIVCKAHRTPGQVWNTLAHEAAHRMQDCAGGPISRPEHMQTMFNTLKRYSPQDISSLRAYPRQQHRIEIEARYTAKLPPNQVMQLFDRYCGSSRRAWSAANLQSKTSGYSVGSSHMSVADESHQTHRPMTT